MYEYFRKVLDEGMILVRINPTNFAGLELIISKDKHVLQTARSFDDSIYDEMAADDFEDGSAMEFNLYLKGIGSDK